MAATHHNGWGVAVNFTEAAKWHRQAAEAGDARSQYWLGKLHEAGTGVSQDVNEAIRWYRKAARQGSEKAKEDLKALGAAP